MMRIISQRFRRSRAGTLSKFLRMLQHLDLPTKLSNSGWKALGSYVESMELGSPVTVPWITATKWTASGKAFSVAADIEHILEKYGDGVYTVVVWAPLDGEDIIVSEYSLFLEGI